MLSSVSIRNAIAHAIHAYESKRERGRQGRHRKLSVSYMLERIFYVCKTGCQWSQLEVPHSSYKTVYHYFNLWSKAHIFENVFYEAIRAKQRVGGAVIADTSFVKNVLEKM